MPDDHSKSVPPLPIPNRTVKRLRANDSAATSVKVGHRQAFIRKPLNSYLLRGFCFPPPNSPLHFTSPPLARSHRCILARFTSSFSFTSTSRWHSMCLRYRASVQPALTSKVFCTQTKKGLQTMVCRPLILIICDWTILFLVGARGFEPPTPCTPCMYATRLRYAPTLSQKL